MTVISLSRVVKIDSVEGGCGDWSAAKITSPIFGSIVCNAATKYVRKQDGALSPLSNDSQATSLPQPAIHSLTSVVFPKPAGAEMRVSLHSKPSFNRSIRRVR
ncbi:MAG: hypothetical protein K8R40_10670 [Anaerolineaceae bacterium]|nr:hypothetical protein [Anaerolineaceae bacterium]